MNKDAKFLGCATVINTVVGIFVPCSDEKMSNKYEVVNDKDTISRMANDIDAEQVAFASIGDFDGLIVGFIVDANALNSDKPQNTRASLALNEPIFGAAVMIAIRVFGNGEYEFIDLPADIFDSLCGT